MALPGHGGVPQNNEVRSLAPCVEATYLWRAV